MNRAVVEDNHDGFGGHARLGTIEVIEGHQKRNKIGAALGAGGGDDQLSLQPVERTYHGVAKTLAHVNLEIVKRPDTAVGFKLVPQRWIVERTIAWPNRCRRLAKDWENLNRKALAFLRLASIRLMLRKLCNPA